MARHLLHLGHRKVAFLNERFAWDGFPSGARLTGFEDTFRAECPEAELIVFNSSAALELSEPNFEYLARERSGYAFTRRCLQERPDVTAIVAVCDIFAYGVLRYLRDSGLRVPEDYSVCGFDNNFAGDLLNLTTYDHRVTEIGKRALALLLEKIAGGGEDAGAIRKLEVIGELIARASTGEARKASVCPRAGGRVR